MVRGLALAGQAQHLRAKFPQVPLDLLLLRALDVVLGGVLQVRLDLSVTHRRQNSLDDINSGDFYWIKKTPNTPKIPFVLNTALLKLQILRLSSFFNCIFFSFISSKTELALKSAPVSSEKLKLLKPWKK